MSRKAQRIRAVGLSLVTALVLTAMTAAAAQAETYASVEVKVEGKTLKEAGIQEVEMVGPIGAGQLNFSGAVIHCESGQVEEALIGQGGTGSAAATFIGCVLEDESGTVDSHCTIYDNGSEEEPGVITAAGLVDLIRGTSNGKHYAELSPEVGEPFATIYLVGSRCAFPEENEVSGVAAFLIPAATTEAVSHSLEEVSAAEEEELGVALLPLSGDGLVSSALASVHLTGASPGDWSLE